MEIQRLVEVLGKYQLELQNSVLDAFHSKGGEFGRERYDNWMRRFTKFLDEYLPGESTRLERRLTKLVLVALSGESAAQEFWRDDGKIIDAFIDSLVVDFNQGTYEPPRQTVTGNQSLNELRDADSILSRIFARFHVVVKSLRRRHADRSTLNINDEYDVQDLLKALLLVEFEDVRSEEWTPSHGGQSSRADFLLKNEKIIVEVKMTRDGLADREIGTQLIVDIERYRSHPNCKKLICFIYDPDGRIVNPTSIQNDLVSQSRSDLVVNVFIFPQ